VLALIDDLEGQANGILTGLSFGKSTTRYRRWKPNSVWRRAGGLPW
jgi:hypothetical protein